MTVSVTFKIGKSLISDLKLLLRYGECACVWCQRSVSWAPAYRCTGIRVSSLLVFN